MTYFYRPNNTAIRFEMLLGKRRAPIITTLGRTTLLGLVSLWASALAAIELNSVNPLEQGDLAPNWIVATSSGQKMSLHHEIDQGDKVVVIFWATWCRYCEALLPELNALKESSSAGNTHFIALNIWEDGDPARYIIDKGISIPYSIKADEIANQYSVKGTPGVFVIGEDYTILYRRQTGQSTKDVIASVTHALKDTSAP